MLGLPAAANKVGNQSSPEMMPFSILPAGSVPGQRIMGGPREPPPLIGPLSRPADHGRDAEAALHDRALALRERGLSAVRPRKHLSAVVGGEDDNGIVIDAHILELLHHDADIVVE